MAKEAALGAAFKTTVGGTPVTVAQVKSISGPDVSVDTIDVTTHDSTSGWEEHVAGVIRSGEITLELVYDTANAQVVDFLSNLGTAQAMSIEFNNTAADTMSFSGLPTGFSQSLPHEGSIDATLTIKPTGVITFPS